MLLIIAGALLGSLDLLKGWQREQLRPPINQE
jgi:hypothetical protein